MILKVGRLLETPAFRLALSLLYVLQNFSLYVIVSKDHFFWLLAISGGQVKFEFSRQQIDHGDEVAR